MVYAEEGKRVKYAHHCSSEPTTETMTEPKNTTEQD